MTDNIYEDKNNELTPESYEELATGETADENIASGEGISDDGQNFILVESDSEPKDDKEEITLIIDDILTDQISEYEEDRTGLQEDISEDAEETFSPEDGTKEEVKTEKTDEAYDPRFSRPPKKERKKKEQRGYSKGIILVCCCLVFLKLFCIYGLISLLSR